MPELTPDRFDAMMRDGRQASPKIIWTLAAIGHRLGRGKDFARILASRPGSPIRRQGRQYFVFESELLQFMNGAKEGK